MNQIFESYVSQPRNFAPQASIDLFSLYGPSKVFREDICQVNPILSGGNMAIYSIQHHESMNNSYPMYSMATQCGSSCSEESFHSHGAYPESPVSNKLRISEYSNILSQYWLWNENGNFAGLNALSMSLNNYQRGQMSSNSNKPHLENLEEVKQVFGSQNPCMTKDEMYDELLKPYKCEKIVNKDFQNDKEKVIYVCKYENCDKRFTKTWNLLDHVRMHEGIRPFQCPHCPKSFTQKGNLKKHQIQHTISTLKERKRFKCHICGKGYTEKYNLEVSHPFLSFGLCICFESF